VSFVDADGRNGRSETASADAPETEPGHQFKGNGLTVPPVTEPGPQLQGARLAVPAKRWLRPTGRVILALAVVLGLAILSVSLVRSRGRRPTAIRSLAVLPLENLSGDAAQNYFSDGMTDELITDLAQISALRVISRTSVMVYKGAHKSLPQIARELNVDAVVEAPCFVPATRSASRRS
jgi:hypothetical protein